MKIREIKDWLKGTTETYRSSSKPNIQEITEKTIVFTLTFEDFFKGINCRNQFPCPKCNGTGFMSLTGYFDQGAICFTICPLCAGCGSVNDSKEINYKKIKKEIENYNLSLYLDESKTLFN